MVVGCGWGLGMLGVRVLKVGSGLGATLKFQNQQFAGFEPSDLR